MSIPKYMTPESRDESQRRIEAIRCLLPELFKQRHKLLEQYIEPVRIVLPECLDPDMHDGEGRIERPATILNLPITFEGAEIKVIGKEEA